jgi:hypothetical protein
MGKWNEYRIDASRSSFVGRAAMATAQQKAEQAFARVVEWLEHFEELEDPRQQDKVWYPLDEMLLLCLLAVLAGADSWVEVAAFGKAKPDLLRRFAPFEKGTPSHDQLGDLFAVLDAEQFQACFVARVGSLTRLAPDIVAIDGKTLGRAYQEGGCKAAIHMASAFAARQRSVLGARCSVRSKWRRSRTRSRPFPRCSTC